MKKILGLSLLAAIAALSVNAADTTSTPSSKYEFGVNIGGAMDYMRVDGDTVDEGGTILGVSAYKKVSSTVSYGTEVEAGIFDDYETYSLELNGKYNFTPKLGVSAGLSYNYLDGDDSEHSDGVGAQAKVDYDVWKKVGVYAKYKFTDLDNGISNSQRISTGVSYKF